MDFLEKHNALKCLDNRPVTLERSTEIFHLVALSSVLRIRDHDYNTDPALSGG